MEGCHALAVVSLPGTTLPAPAPGAVGIGLKPSRARTSSTVKMPLSIATP